MNNENSLSPDGDEQYKFNLRIVFITFVLATIVLIQFILLGSYDYLSSGMNEIINSINSLSNSNNQISYYLNQLNSEGIILQKDFTLSVNTSCSLIQYNSYLNNNYFPGIQAANNQLIATNKFTDASNLVDYYGNTVRIYTVWGLYIIIMLIPMFYSLFLYLEYKITTKVLIGLVEVILFILFILCGAQFISLVNNTNDNNDK